MAESGEGFHSPAFGVNRNGEAPRGVSDVWQTQGLFPGVLEVWQSLDLAGVFSDLWQGKELAKKWRVARGRAWKMKMSREGKDAAQEEIHRDLEKGSGEGGAAKSCGMVARISYVVKTKGRYGMATEGFRAFE